MKSPHRFIELDIWRGLAILGMILFHLVFLLDYLGVQQMSYGQGGWHALARIVQWSFLLLVGIGLQLSYQKSRLLQQSKMYYLRKNLSKGLLVFYCGLMITFVSYIFAPEEFVRFGVLHLIGVSIVILSFLADRPFFCLFLSLVIFLVSWVVNAQPVSSEWLAIFGFSYSFQALDHFAIFPWLAVPALGVFLGSRFYRTFQRTFPIPQILERSKISKALALLGKNSLLIYLIHIPLLIALIELIY